MPFFVFVAEFFFQSPRAKTRAGGERRREPKAFLFLTKSFVLILTSRIFSFSGYRRVTKTSRTRPFPILGRAFRSLRLWAEGVDGCEKQATTKTVKRRGTDESKQIKRDDEDFSGGRYWIVQTGTFSMGRFRARKLLFWIGLSSPRVLLNFGSRTALSHARARSGNHIKQ